MTMIAVAEFLSRVEEIAAEEPSYRHGGYGQDGTCDCIGIIIGAIRRCGGEWRGLHGSNYAARREIAGGLSPITGTADLSTGDVVFKAWEPGTGGYDLPDRYEHGGAYYNGDLMDYYHVGVVVSVYPLRIRHMTTPRPKMDTSIGKWAYHGKLKKIGYTESGGQQMETYQAKVIGGGLNLRKDTSSASVRITQIPEGSIVSVLEERGDWCRVNYAGLEGFVMAKFLERMNESHDTATITVDRMRLEAIYDELGDLLGLRG